MAAEASGGGPGLIDMFFIAAIALVFYFVVWRPQSKRSKEHKELIGSLAKGDEIVTNGGMIGKVSKIEEQYLLVEIANNVQIKLQRGAVAAALPKGTIKSID